MATRRETVLVGTRCSVVISDTCCVALLGRSFCFIIVSLSCGRPRHRFLFNHSNMIELPMCVPCCCLSQVRLFVCGVFDGDLDLVLLPLCRIEYIFLNDVSGFFVASKLLLFVCKYCTRSVENFNERCFFLLKSACSFEWSAPCLFCARDVVGVLIESRSKRRCSPCTIWSS